MRRSLLLEGLAASLRLPESAVVAPPTPGARGAAASAGGELSDGVFLRLMALPKGKKLLARALRVVYPAPEASQPRRSALVEGEGGELPPLPQRPNLRVVWAALRSLRTLFAGRPGLPEDTLVSAAVAEALAEVLRRLHSPEAVADCLVAVLGGDLDGAPLMDAQPDAVLMPLYAPGACCPCWAALQTVLPALSAVPAGCKAACCTPASVPAAWLAG
jgi:DNA topoisomerase 2-associated protein PAT1